jgi:hypothetical protein
MEMHIAEVGARLGDESFFRGRDLYRRLLLPPKQKGAPEGALPENQQ